MSNSYFLTFIYIELGVFNGAKNGIGFETMDKFYKLEELNFQPSSYTTSQGKDLPMYKMTRDGWAILVMGFTGKKAMSFKEKDIAAFNAMEAEF